MICLILVILCIIIFIILGSWLSLNRKNQYWTGKGISTPKPSILFGNYADYFLMKKNLGDNVAAICAQFPDSPIIGTYFGTEPAVIIQDPELLRLVFAKDFHYFNSRELADHNHREPFFTNIFNATNDTWKSLRQTFNPLFSPAKMKSMFHLIQKNTVELSKYMDELMKINSVHEVKDITARFTVDCIASCIFGYEGQSLNNSSKDKIFKEIADEVVNFTTKRQIKFMLRQVWPNVFYATRNLAVQKDVETFFERLLQSAFEARNYAPGSRNDFVDYLLNIKLNGIKTSDANGKAQLEITDAMLTGQCMVFFGAGFETSASTMEFTLFELAKHPDALERVQQEIDHYLREHDFEITYECLSQLPYLEACVNETMRKYAVLGAITREIVEDYTMPSGLVLEKGVRVFIPTYHIHNNPDYFPAPEAFRPERFLPENRSSIKPYTYFPFGEGPRICIGKRFAHMQVYAGLVTVLRKYRVELPAQQPRELSFEPRSFVTAPTKTVRLKFIPRHVPSSTR